MITRLIYLTSLFICFNAQAWNVNGHLLVADIAYENLTPTAKVAVDQLTQKFQQGYPTYNTYELGSYWPDDLRASGVNAFSSWHFIDRPFIKGIKGTKGSGPRNYAKENVVWAIMQSEDTLQSAQAAPMSKAIFLMFLTHFVADIHQPMHCITLYNKQFPKGDKGGTLYTIQSPIANNLHELWDKGGDFFYQNRHSTALSMQGIPALAKKIQTDYPTGFFGDKVNDLDPKHWSYESYDLAKESAYQVSYKGVPSSAYIAKMQQISEQQVALAGYRLAKVLNQIFV
jgi:hypothetical protein